MADNDNDNESSEETSEVDFAELPDEMQEKLAAHPEVRRFIEYEETSIPQISSMLGNLQDGDNEDTFDLWVEGIAERSGRVTEATVRKVLTNAVEEYNSVSQ